MENELILMGNERIQKEGMSAEEYTKSVLIQSDYPEKLKDLMVWVKQESKIVKSMADKEIEEKPRARNRKTSPVMFGWGGAYKGIIMLNGRVWPIHQSMD